LIGIPHRLQLYAVAVAPCGVVVMYVEVFYLDRIRCPISRERLGTIGLSVALRKMNAPNYCPFCGIGFDVPTPP
jgi:hypothetical protein